MKSLMTLALLVATAGSMLPTGVAADTPSIAFPGDNRLITFIYDANDTYTILTRPRSVTNIALRQGESVVALALGDTTQWMSEIIDGHIFIKPLRENIFTTGTLVTNQRTYQLTLRASPENGKFYQRVTWEYPTLVRHRAETPSPNQPTVTAAASDAPNVTAAVDITKVRFGYTSKGEAPFKPTNVFDDGVFTYLRLPSNLQDMPAVFIQGIGTSKLELTNFVLKGDHLIVQRLADRIVLKLGKAEVEIASPNEKALRERKSFVSSLFNGGNQ